MSDRGAVDLRDRAAIVGIGQTAFAKHLDRPEKVLALEAIGAALDDAGIDAGEVDGLSSYTLETTEEIEIARNLGLGDLSYFGQVGYGGGAGCGVVGQAAMAVATGQCNVAVAWRSRKRGSAASRPWARVSAGGRHPAVEPAVRVAPPRRRDRHADAALPARVRGDPRPPGQRGPRLPAPRQPQPGRDHARPSADPRGVPLGPLGVRAAVPVRQLPRDRRCLRRGHLPDRSGPRHMPSRPHRCMRGPSRSPASTRP